MFFCDDRFAAEDRLYERIIGLRQVHAETMETDFNRRCKHPARQKPPRNLLILAESPRRVQIVD